MKIVVTRIDAHRYSTTVERDDGVYLRIPGIAFMRALPHDLAHYVVEHELRLGRGFWGSVAEGAKFRGMTLLHGRQKPHAEERARRAERDNASHLSSSERLVAVFETIVAESLDAMPPAAASRLKTAMGSLAIKPVSLSEIGSVCARWREMQSRWDAVPVGDCIKVNWGPGGPRGRMK